MRSQPFLQANSQDGEGSSYSHSSGSNFSRNTWSSSTKGLIQIGSFRFANSGETDELSMGEDINHRFSVIIHDNTDVESLAAVSSHQIESFHGLEDPNVVSKLGRRDRAFEPLEAPEAMSVSSKSKNKRAGTSSLQKPSRVVQPIEENSFDRFCSAFEGLVCREGDEELVKVAPVKQEKQEVAVPPPPPVVSHKHINHVVVENRDALDTIFEGVEGMTCGPGKRESSSKKKRSPTTFQHPPKADLTHVDTRDPLDRVFDGVEIMACGPDSSHREAFKRFGPVKTKTMTSKDANDILDHTCESVEHYTCRMDGSKEPYSQDRDFLDTVFDGVESATCSQKTPKRGNTSGTPDDPIQVPFETQMVKMSGSQDDVLDSLCNGVEYAMCRDEAVGLRQRNKKDILDHVFDPGCAESENGNQSYNENSMVASESESAAEGSIDSEEREESETRNQQDSDLLDYIFESVEAKTCRSNKDDLSTVGKSTKKKRGGNRLFGKFRSNKA